MWEASIEVPTPPGLSRKRESWEVEGARRFVTTAFSGL
jgi:hypothetical protein